MKNNHQTHMHDEKKIEEIDFNLLHYNKENILKAMKQYAEHMVQQERERIVKEIYSLNYHKFEEKECIEDIINLINKQDE